MDKARIIYLLQRYRDDHLSREEWEALRGALAGMREEDFPDDALRDAFHRFETHPEWTPDTQQAVWDRIKTVTVAQPSVRIRPLRWRIAAAVAILIGGTAVTIALLRQQPPSPPATVAATNTDDAPPGSNKAVLTLSDGSTLTLDSSGRKQLSHGIVQQGATIRYAAPPQGGEVAYNTLRTPPGGQFKVVLPDGTSVWLNAGSSLRYPTSFAGKVRQVRLEGEAFFDVAQNPAQPFVVETNRATATVLGTSFNINSYPDEDNLVTTLVTGSLRVSSTSATQLLHPGEQTVLGANGAMLSRKGVNTEEFTAWKDGRFYFDNTPLTVILRQFSRWYDVEVIYTTPVADRKFFGVIDRKTPLAGVLKLLNANDIKFQIKGKKLYVGTS
ncbi:FecR family protein [Chitinophaga lutea]